MTQNNSAGRGPRGEQRRQRAGPASPAQRPGPTLPRGQEPTGGNPAGRAQARRPPRRPSPSNGDAHSPAGPNGEVIDRVETRGPNPASLPGAGSRSASAAVREQITADRPLRSAGSAFLCFLFSHRERGQETLDAAASRTTRGRRGLADDQTRAATAPCASSATPPRGGGQTEASGNHGLIPAAASRQAGCKEVARAGPRAPGQRAERIHDKGHSLGPGDRTGSDWEGSAWEEDLAILRKSVALESHLGEKKNAG